MATYRVLKTFMLKPDDWDDKAGRWDAGGWVASLDSGDTIFEYSGSGAQSEAQAKADELSASDADGREYMVEEIG